MNTEIKAAAIQFNLKLGDVDANMESALNGIERAAAAGAQIAVLPEMWSSGYDYRRLAELSDRTPEVLERLCAVSKANDIILVGSLPEKQNDILYNMATVIEDGSIKGSYRKLHMFSTMGEDRFLSPGNSTLVVDTKIGRVGVAICYDLRFPELFRKMALDGAELICIPAEWPKPRQEHWRTLLRARAIENQLFIAAANCCGIQGKLDFFGMSLLISSKGEVLAEAGETDMVLSASFDRKEMQTYREQIRCFADRRPEIYGTLT
jgi:predicted amidohydrolase